MRTLLIVKGHLNRTCPSCEPSFNSLWSTLHRYRSIEDINWLEAQQHNNPHDFADALVRLSMERLKEIDIEELVGYALNKRTRDSIESLCYFHTKLASWINDSIRSDARDWIRWEQIAQVSNPKGSHFRFFPHMSIEYEWET